MKRYADTFQVGDEYETGKGRARILQANLESPTASGKKAKRRDWFEVELLDAKTGISLGKDPILLNSRSFYRPWYRVELKEKVDKLTRKIEEQARVMTGKTQIPVRCSFWARNHEDDFALTADMEAVGKILPLPAIPEELLEKERVYLLGIGHTKESAEHFAKQEAMKKHLESLDMPEVIDVSFSVVDLSVRRLAAIGILDIEEQELQLMTEFWQGTYSHLQK